MNFKTRKLPVFLIMLYAIGGFAETHSDEQNYHLGVMPVTVHDESSDGDLGDRLRPTPIEFLNESNRIAGTVGGSGVESDDCFVFVTPEKSQMSTLIVEYFEQVPPSNNTSIHFYSGLPETSGSFGDVYSNIISEGRIGSDVLFGNGDQITGGQFTFCLLENTPNQVYSLIFNLEIRDLIFANGFESLD